MATPREIIPFSLGDLSQGTLSNLVQVFSQAMERAGVEQARHLRTLGQLLSVEAIPPDTRRRVHNDVGLAAQRSVVNAYTHRSGRRQLPSYREGTDPRRTRFAGQKLLRALQSSSFFDATPNDLAFINVTLLNKEARQWRRLNFGAGGAAGARPRSFPVDLFNASIGLQPDPRPAFRLPPGFWMRGGEAVAPGAPGTAQFYPYSGSGASARGRMTRGIRATNFLDAGIRRIASEIGPAYDQMYRNFYNDRSARLAVRQQHNIRATRPVAIRHRRLR